MKGNTNTFKNKRLNKRMIFFSEKNEFYALHSLSRTILVGDFAFSVHHRVQKHVLKGAEKVKYRPKIKRVLQPKFVLYHMLVETF